MRGESECADDREKRRNNETLMRKVRERASERQKNRGCSNTE